MRQGMAIFIIFASESLNMVRTGSDRTFLWSFRLMSEHVGFQIFKRSTTVRMWAAALFPSIIIEGVRITTIH